MTENIVKIAVPAIIWAILHSMFAAVWMKVIFQRLLGRYYYLYRFIYSSASLITLALLVKFTPGRDIIAYSFDGWASVPFYFSSLCGIVIGYFASKNICWREFVGLKQISRLIRKESLSEGEKISGEKTELRTDGLFAYSRHPIYLAAILFIIGFPQMSLQQLVISIIFILYMFVGALFEEKRLILEFGDAYLDYKKNVPFIIPFLVKPLSNDK